MNLLRNNKKTIAIIQARMSSTRLPGKVMLNLAMQPALIHCYERVNRANGVFKTVVATTTNPADDTIVNFCKDNRIEVFRGSESDVLQRVYACAEQYNAYRVVEITADCPAVCTETIEDLIGVIERRRSFDYVSNTMIRSFPDGCDIQVYKMSVLKYADYFVQKPEHRSHVGWNIWNNKNINAKCLNVCDPRDLSKIEITLDEMKDYELLDHIFTWFETIGLGNYFTYEHLVDYLLHHPRMLKINRAVKRKTPGEG